MPIGCLHVSFGTKVYSNPVYFYIEVFFYVECMSPLFIFAIKPLSDISFANIFSHSIGRLVHFVDSFLCCEKSF